MEEENKKEISTKELKKIQLNILKIIDNYCKKNNIDYFLFAGTLLGAVRHEGYIPWDDDIDIALKRKDYEFLIKNFSKENNVEIISYEKNNKFYLPFAKAINTSTLLKEEVSGDLEIGVYIDIFPLDTIPSDKVKKIVFKNIFLTKILDIKNLMKKKRNLLKTIIFYIVKILCFPFSKKFLIKKIISNSQKYSNDKCDKIGFICDLKNIWDKADFDKVIYLTFEEEKYSCPKGFDNILTHRYGDYMKYPPKNEQIYHHKFKAWWKN